MFGSTCSAVVIMDGHLRQNCLLLTARYLLCLILAHLETGVHKGRTGEKVYYEKRMKWKARSSWTRWLFFCLLGMSFRLGCSRLCGTWPPLFLTARRVGMEASHWPVSHDPWHCDMVFICITHTSGQMAEDYPFVTGTFYWQ